jgi:hypothetical protein
MPQSGCAGLGFSQKVAARASGSPDFCGQWQHAWQTAAPSSQLVQQKQCDQIRTNFAFLGVGRLFVSKIAQISPVILTSICQSIQVFP